MCITMKKIFGQTRKALAIMPVLLFVLLTSPLTVIAQQDFDQGKGEVNRGDVATIRGFERIFSNLVTIVLELAAIILFIMFIIGGFKYLTSQGDPKAVEAARGTLTHAIIGLVVLLLAYVFLTIIEAITGAQITNFRVGIY